jgi:AmmeMemoRadiSam system protein A
VGGAETERLHATVGAMQQAVAEVVRTSADGVVILSPHGPVFLDAMAVHMLTEISGDLEAFGAPDLRINVPIDQSLGELLVAAGRAIDLPIAPVTAEWAEQWQAEQLDYGSLVPLWFLHQAGWRGAVLPVAVGHLPPLRLYAFGQALQKAIDQSGRRIAVLASGDLSHRLTADAPAGFHPAAAQFDREVVEALGRGDMGRLFALGAPRREQAAECGIRPLMVLAGILDGLGITSQVLSYEAPFGVGYCVAEFRPGAPLPERALLPRLEQARREQLEARRAAEHPVARLARAALEQYVTTGLAMDFSAAAPYAGTAPEELPDGLPDRAAVFVTLTVDGETRGCMGSTEPCEPSLALEIAQIAVLSGTEDPRFTPVEQEELAELVYQVDILDAPEPCKSEQLEPQRFGIIVEAEQKRGILLPNLPGVETAAEQFAVACQKAGLAPETPGLRIARFGVQRYQ